MCLRMFLSMEGLVQLVQLRRIVCAASCGSSADALLQRLLVVPSYVVACAASLAALYLVGASAPLVLVTCFVL